MKPAPEPPGGAPEIFFHVRSESLYYYCLRDHHQNYSDGYDQIYSRWQNLRVLVVTLVESRDREVRRVVYNVQQIRP